MRSPYSHRRASIALAPLLLGLVLLAHPASAQSRRGTDGDQTMTLVVGGIEHPLRVLRRGDDVFLNLGDLAAAVGGAWGRDPLSRDPLLTLGDDRVMFSTRDRRIAVNGRRRRLSRPSRLRAGAVWVPSDFVEEHLTSLVDERLILLESPPSPPPATPPPLGDAAPSPERPELAGPGGPLDLPRRRATRGGPYFIVLDPGHGGEEKGAEGPTGLLEKDVVLEVARRLRIHLERRGYKVHLTRSRDLNVPLEERTAVANNRQADLFLSLHANASSSRHARGAETYYLSLDRAERARHEAEPGAYLSTDERSDALQMILWDMAQSSWLSESSRLAEIIQTDFNRALEIPDRGVKQAPFRVLVGATMPAVLVEIGFISNPDEEERLRDPDFLNLIIRSLLGSIEAYRETRWVGDAGRSDAFPGRNPQ